MPEPAVRLADGIQAAGMVPVVAGGLSLAGASRLMVLGVALGVGP